MHLMVIVSQQVESQINQPAFTDHPFFSVAAKLEEKQQRQERRKQQERHSRRCKP